MASIAVNRGSFTIEDIDTFPSDGNRYELIEGSLHVTPSPNLSHQRVAANVFRLLDQAAPSELEVFFAPLDVVLGPATVVQPDVLVLPASLPPVARVETTPLLVVEVLSPSTRLYDLGTKRLVYRNAAVPACWLVDPVRPAVTVWRWDGDDEQEQVIAGDGSASLDWPYPVTLSAAALVRSGS